MGLGVAGGSRHLQLATWAERRREVRRVRKGKQEENAVTKKGGNGGQERKEWKPRDVTREGMRSGIKEGRNRKEIAREVEGVWEKDRRKAGRNCQEVKGEE